MKEGAASDRQRTNHGDEETNIGIETDVSAHEIESLFSISNSILNRFHLDSHDLRMIVNLRSLSSFDHETYGKDFHGDTIEFIETSPST